MLPSRPTPASRSARSDSVMVLVSLSKGIALFNSPVRASHSRTCPSSQGAASNAPSAVKLRPVTPASEVMVRSPGRPGMSGFLQAEIEFNRGVCRPRRLEEHHRPYQITVPYNGPLVKVLVGVA